jgi:hypothetical protein
MSNVTSLWIRVIAPEIFDMRVPGKLYPVILDLQNNNKYIVGWFYGATSFSVNFLNRSEGAIVRNSLRHFISTSPYLFNSDVMINL